MIRISGMLALGAAFAIASSANAATFDWTGDTDLDWAGANWTVGGSPAQVAADEFTGSGHAKIFNYMSDANADTVTNGDDVFNIGAGDVIDNFAPGVGNPGYGTSIPYFEDNTIINITDGANVKLYANLWLPTKVLDNASMTITDSTAVFTRGNNFGNGLVIGDTADVGSTPSVTVSNSSVTVNQLDSGNGNDEGGTLEMFASGSLDLSNSSSLNVSHRWIIDDQSAATVTDSTVDVGFTSTSSDSAKDIDLWDDGSLDIDNSTVNVQRRLELNSGGTTVDITNGSIVTAALTRVAGGTLTVTSATLNADLSNNSGGTMNFNDATINAGTNELWSAGSSSVTNANDVTLTAGSIRTNDDSSWVFDDGSITLSSNNAFRSNNTFNGTDFNWIGDAGDGILTTTDNTDGTRNMAAKIAKGYFSIDGTQVDPVIDDTFDFTDLTNLDALNAELATLVVNGKFFVMGYDGTDPANNDMTLVLATPEPASLALIGIGGLLLARRRRG